MKRLLLGCAVTACLSLVACQSTDAAPSKGPERIEPQPELGSLSLSLDAGPSGVVTTGPCASHEPNDTLASATRVDGGTLSGLALCGNDTDIFAVHVPAGTVLTAGVDFKNAVGDIDLYLTDGTLLADGGTKWIARSATAADGEEIANFPSAQERDLYIIAKGWTRPDAGMPDEGPYQLSVKVEPANPDRDCLQDCQQLLPMQASSLQTSVQAKRDGYYRVSPEKYVWARKDLAGLIRYAVKAVQQKFPASRTDALALSDICQADGLTPGSDVGSPRHPTTTHVRGNDADLAYFQTDGASNYQIICGDGSDNNNNGVTGQFNDGAFCTTSQNVVDVPRQVFFMAKLAESPYYRVIGIDQTLVAPFTAEAERLLKKGEITAGQFRRLTDGLGYGAAGGWQFHHHHIHLSLADPR